MSQTLSDLIKKNKKFAESYEHQSLGFTQHPHTLWIGCVDSRVSPELVTASVIGDLLVHRNMGNLVKETDHTNGLVHFAVKLLGIRNIVVCGHTNCGACYRSIRGGLHGMDIWLRDSRNRYLQQNQPKSSISTDSKSPTKSPKSPLSAVSSVDSHTRGHKRHLSTQDELTVQALTPTDNLHEHSMEQRAQELSKVNTLNAIDVIALHEDVIEVWEKGEDLMISALFLNVEQGSLEILKTISKDSLIVE
eukprot:NODE_472_length_8038_cov_0.413150.p6 type:complete len:248 gc:universal NODE_472_length_8038_cov_0.413150:3004-2261(-)